MSVDRGVPSSSIADMHFSEELAIRQYKIRNYLAESKFPYSIPDHLERATQSYIKAGGKYMRAVLVMLACGAMGADEELSLPAAASVEVFHVSSLVHDDIFDRDVKRRGKNTVHVEFKEAAINELGVLPRSAEHYGMSLAIIAGVLQQGWAIDFLTKLDANVYSKKLVLNLIHELTSVVLPKLLTGEALDIQYSLLPIDEINEQMLIEMIKGKTGALYRFCGQAGASIGLNYWAENKRISALAEFGEKCGIAFQLVDDILGVLGNEQTLRKSVASDIREGKRTMLVIYAFHHANRKGQELLKSALGKKDLSLSQIYNVIEVFQDSGAIMHTKRLAERFISESHNCITALPDSSQKRLLDEWAQLILYRES